ncbi:hypothetical protein HN51_065762 [Arachis hypogaea]|uniref:uncharacterized protein LOC110262352 n=1 Tax=Arachis ipaensis TaxID=130454 RepID=UPI0007AF22F6|nr:uncharacterized protein LOC110262352 [Arachis ipaensis]XP_020976752.1 uncharacterized protein LOC110262352 [Arachis ipaensis]XP_025646749.1 uncharacterized protein LOC112741833 [Arachis hypogaea]
MAENLMTIVRGQSILEPPLFDGKNYIEWKEHMETFTKSLDFKLWLIIKNGPNVPKKVVNGIEEEKSEDEFDDEDMKSVQQASKARHILLCALINSDVYKDILHFKTAKQIWDELENRDRIINNVNSSTPQTNHVEPKSDQHNGPNFVFVDETGNPKSNDFFRLCVPLYKHALEGNWEEAKMIIKKNERLKNAAIASGWPTVLHIAAGAGVDEKHVHFVQRLMEEFLDEGDLLLQDRNGNTAFFFAAAFGNKQVVDLMLKMNPSVANDRGVKGATAVHFAALQARCEMAWHLYDITKPTFTEDDWNQLFFNCINTGLYGLALEMAEAKPELAYARDYYHNETALHLLAKNHSDSCCQSPHHQSHTIMINPGMKQEVVYQLVKSLWRTICNNFTEDGIINIISEPCQPIFAAAEVGNFGFLSELISGYPSLIWARDEKEQTIIHKAVKYRQASIYNVIHEIGYQKDIIVTIVDTSGNTLLHLAAQIAPPSSLELVSGAAFQMCLELVWFKEVQKIMPPSFIKSTNAEGLTAGELFTREHTQLRKDAESWMKSTAENCMLIATVIATGVFAAAISIPGGVDDAKGKPNYLKKPSFLVFAISDAAAFISSAAAILIFLSILVSRYAESDFYKSLPLKLIFGLLALFCSISSMMVAVASAFFITYYYDSDWVPGFISAFVCLPILLFIILQFKLWYVIMYSTFYCKNLFKPDKKMLYVSKN